MQKETAGIIGAIIIIFIGAFFMLWPKAPKEVQKNTTNNSQVAGAQSEQTTQVEPSEIPMKQTSEPTPPMMIDKTKKYQAVLTTSVGDITIDLNADKTPITVNNFYALVKRHFYDKTIFHRVINGFMIQGGDPTGTGMGGPGYKFDDEKFDGEYTRGTVAMANSGPNTNGSQFFIMHGNTPLPKNYVIFGKVSKGIETVDKIATAPVKPEGEGSSPVDPVSIKSVEIMEK